MTGECVLRLTFDEYKAVAAALISVGDAVLASMIGGHLDAMEDDPRFAEDGGANAVADELLTVITSTIAKLADARDSAWGVPAERN